MNRERTIVIAKEFSKTPKGRYHSEENPNSGERFRSDFLVPSFNNYDKIIIDLDGLYGVPSSFRDEAFGGLARMFSPEAVLSKLEFRSKIRPMVIEQIKKDIVEANA